MRIAELVAEGLTNAQIGAKVGRTQHGIKNAMKKILDKTGMGNRLELALWVEAHK